MKFRHVTGLHPYMHTLGETPPSTKSVVWPTQTLWLPPHWRPTWQPKLYSLLLMGEILSVWVSTCPPHIAITGLRLEICRVTLYCVKTLPYILFLCYSCYLLIFEVLLHHITAQAWLITVPCAVKYMSCSAGGDFSAHVFVMLMKIICSLGHPEPNVWTKYRMCLYTKQYGRDHMYRPHSSRL